MKKITLLLFLFISFSSYSQLDEGFESGIPTTWTVFDNGVGTVQSWGITTNAANVHSGSQAAEVLRGNIGQNNVSEDWLVTPLTTILTNAQLRFFARSNFSGNNGTLYQIRISSASATDPLDVSNYSIIKEYTELQLSAQANVYEEKVESLAAYAGTNRYIAFVRVHKQLGTATTGDSWLLDDVKMVEQCFDPYDLKVTNITAQTAVLGWSHISNAPLYDVEYGPAGFVQGTGTLDSNVSNPHTATGLPANSNCQFYVRAKCDSGAESAWVGPFNFKTITFGLNCAEPISFTSLPFEVEDNTANYGDFFDTKQGSLCGAIPSVTNYLQGNDVFYSYTPATSGPINITMTPIGGESKNASLFVYDACANIGQSCLKGLANTTPNPRSLTLDVVAGQTYIIVISSSVPDPDKPVTQTIPYNLKVQAENCGPKPSALTANNITATTADLTWTSADFSSWQVALQPLGATIPSGDGDYTTQNPYPVDQLDAETKYQYWVRAECTVGSGVYTSWAGPYFFNTSVCELAETCNYTFRMTDLANNGWDGATMQVRQNGLVVATIGSTYTKPDGAGPIDVIVPLCKDVPYDLFWATAGNQPHQCIVSVINSFDQTLYTKAAGEGMVGTILYSDTTNCTTPLCTIAPINLTTTSILTTAATLTWTAPATTLWDVYLVAAGSPAPDASSTPTYANINSNPFFVSGLSVDTTYDFYVRVVCSPMPSEWSTKGTFTTVATCYRPKNLDVTDITSSSASLKWTNANPTDTEWDILLVPSTTMTPPTVLPPTNPSIPGMILISGNTTPSPLTVNTLTPATIYFYYVRTVCSDIDSSVWEGPFVFNTPICDESEKCNYQFTMIDIGGNGWEGGIMEVRQNGILVKAIGPGFTSTGPINVTVALCDGVPFDLYWKTAGDNPQEIGLQILNPFEDVIYTKIPGNGNPSEVLFTSTGNCMPPTCPKPTNLLAPQVALTATSAQLSWTETGGATKWEVYVVPTQLFTSIPENGTPISGVAPYYIADSNPFTVTGLNPSTNYTFYVRAICSPTDISTWTTIHSQKFTTKPLNDECAEAKVLAVNPTKVATLSTTGNTLGATESSLVTNPVCAGNTDDDVWYSFVATSTTHIITISDVKGLTKDMNHVLYSGNNCTALTQMYCSDSDLSVANNLTPGNTYKIRVYTTLSGINQRASFTISVTTPPAITNDECLNAIQTPVNDDLPCVVYASGSLTGASGSAFPNTCIGSADDDVWFSFVANSNIQNISLINVVGTTSDLHYGVYSGACGNLTSTYCSAPYSLTGITDTFVVGQTYFVRVWSNSGVPQDVTFDLCIGKIVPPITTSTTLYNATQLVEDILLNTKCASVSNVTSSTGVNFGEVNGIGYFNKSLSGFPFKDGVILSCASALTAPGPNIPPTTAETQSWPGDSDLTQIVYEATGATGKTYNATKLEFDFVPVSDKISFNFIFASEEYGTFQCSYSDVFAFILTNTETGETTNLAIVPNTTDPISVTTIRDELYNQSCNSRNETYFDKYYGDKGLNPLGAPINFNGVTVPMIASAVTVPGVKYHIKMAIADYLDQNLDSAIFLEGGSFNIGSVELGESLTGANALCQGGSTTLVSDLDPEDYTFEWLKDDVIIPNEKAPNLVVTSPGVYAIKAQFGVSTCFATDSVTIEYYQEATPGKPNDLIVCDATITSGVFDLTKNSAIILAPYTANDHTVAYFLSQTDADNNVNAISTPESYTNTTTLQTIYARISNSFISCHTTTSFQIGFQDLTPKFTVEGSTSYCPNGSTTIKVVPINNNFDPSQVSYAWAFNGNLIEGQTTNSLFINTNAGYGTYKVTVTNSKCSSTKEVVITENKDTFLIAITSECEGKNYKLVASPVNESYDATKVTYEWTGPSFELVSGSSNTIILKATGEYTVKVVTTDGCISEESINVSEINCLIQKGISPNGDGLNESFLLNDTKKLQIFNRYGTRVYSLSNYSDQWHGQTDDGDELPDGTYYYVIERNNEETVTGWIYINR